MNCQTTSARVLRATNRARIGPEIYALSVEERAGVGAADISSRRQLLSGPEVPGAHCGMSANHALAPDAWRRR